jgi:hypothetical protein
METEALTRLGVRSLSLGLLLGWAALLSVPVQAHETDNFYLPLDVELADLGDFFGALHTWVIEQAVQEANERVERALKHTNPASRAQELEKAHDPELLAHSVATRFGHAFTETFLAANAMHGSWAREAFPGKKAAHGGVKMNLSGRFPLDPRILLMLNQSDTVKAHGVYFGTDKLTHLHQLGYTYYQHYRLLLRKGLSQEEAYHNVVERYAHKGMWAEDNLFGSLTTGVYSNADMAVNHIGFKFFLNLTERVLVKGKEREPLVVRNGVFWRVSHHVRPQSGWWAVFVSDHWNEALNPNLYDPTMRPGVRRVLRGRAEHIVRFYTEKDGRPNDPAYFDQLAHELSTYDGEPYGHSGHFEKIMTIGNTCFPEVAKKLYPTNAPTVTDSAAEATPYIRGAGAPAR